MAPLSIASHWPLNQATAWPTAPRIAIHARLAKYKARYAELHEDLEEADSCNDLGRIAQLQSEMDAFELELARATGLGGRKRQRSDVGRVCKSVSMAVTRAIDSIRDEHDLLGRHLRNSIAPGLTFRYDPERDPGWLT